MQNPIKRIARVYKRDGILALLATPYRLYRRKASLTAQARVADLAGKNLSAKEKFRLIYEERLWSKASPTLKPSNSLSGHGSTEESTREFRSQLEAFLRKENVRTFFDAPCGDFVWMQLVRFPPECGYIGGDIVDSVITSLSSAYAFEPLESSRVPLFRRFISCDLTESALPKADVWLCKDCIQHLSNSDIKKVLRNFASSEIKTAIITNHTNVQANRDINTGDFRHVDLTKSPFNLPRPRDVLLDKPVDGELRQLAVWDRAQVLQSIGNWN